MLVRGATAERLSVGVLSGLVLALTFATNPFLFEKKGWQFFTAFRAADPDIFANDRVIEILASFWSAYYVGLGALASALGIGAENVGQLTHVLFILYRLLLVVGIWLLVSSITKNLWTGLIAVALTLQPKTAPLGAETDVSVFVPMITHLEVAFLLCLFALVLHLRFDKRLTAWLLVALSIFVHPIAAVHFGGVFGLGLLGARRMRWVDVWGCALLLVSAGIYARWLAPEPLSPASAQLFLAEVRTWKHVGLYHYGFVSWAIALGVGATAVLAAGRWQNHNPAAGTLRWAILLSVPAALALATLSLTVDSVRLVQIQPIRIFLWIHFLSLLLIALNVIPAFRHDKFEGILLLAILVLLTARTGWVVPFLAVALAHYLVLSVKWLQRFQPARIFSIFSSVAIPEFRFGMVAFALMLMASGVAAANPAIADDGESGPDWDRVRNWVRQETPKTEKFLTTTTGADFSVRALRASVSTGGGALAWVDPVMFQQSRARVERVRKAQANGVWDLDSLSTLAREWGASYLLIKGSFTPNAFQPLCRFGVYAVFPVAPSPGCCDVS